MCKWEVRSFGLNCLGNIKGYVVERYRMGHHEVAEQFIVGNIYERSSFETAHQQAADLAERLNHGSA
jgi:hypothetical protein